MKFSLLILPLFIALAFSKTLLAADVPLKELLTKPILDAMAVQNEVQAFCDARVPKVPQAASKEEWEKLATKMRAETLEKVVFRGEAAKWRDREAPRALRDYLTAARGSSSCGPRSR